jgi:hypothetical protein
VWHSFSYAIAVHERGQQKSQQKRGTNKKLTTKKKKKSKIKTKRGTK